METTKDTLHALPEVLNELSVVTRDDNGRSRVFAHRDMLDVTKRPPARGVATETLSDLISWLKQYGKPEESAVYFSSEKSGNSPTVAAYLSETWRGQNGLAKFELKPARALSRWLGPCSNGEQSGARQFAQEDLVKFLEAWGARDVKTPATAALLAFQKTLRDLSLAVSITYNKKLEDENNLRLEFKVEEKSDASAAQIPKQWLLFLPIFEGGPLYEIPARLAYRIPVKENEAAATRFLFEAPTLPAIFEAAVEDVRKQLKAELGDGWQVFRGSPSVSQKEREEAPF